MTFTLLDSSPASRGPQDFCGVSEVERPLIFVDSFPVRTIRSVTCLTWGGGGDAACGSSHRSPAGMAPHVRTVSTASVPGERLRTARSGDPRLCRRDFVNNYNDPKRYVRNFGTAFAAGLECVVDRIELLCYEPFRTAYVPFNDEVHD